MLQEIIKPVNKDLLKRELTKSKFIRYTNNGSNEIYIVSSLDPDSSNIIQEIGRLREFTFRSAGGGTGMSVDLDDFDFGENPYKQLIVWSPADEEIVGGYRFIRCADASKDKNGEFLLATSHLFKFSKKFENEFMPHTIELGRSFVQPLYQPATDQRKGLFSLDNIWDGLGAIVIDNPDIKYFFGKVTMYLNFNQKARDLILYFLQKHFPDKDKLVTPHVYREIYTSKQELDAIFCGQNYQEDYKILVQNVRILNEHIPPLVNAYMNLSPSMLTFGTTLNDQFGEVEETGILVTISDIYDLKKERHLDSYKKSDK
ncbi:MAG: GNAT family N-acetyltransferase [Bacteroidetes bacterium]|nr:GNAT family N-acetyltransferase [Bacteroidota bacterium]